MRMPPPRVGLLVRRVSLTIWYLEDVCLWYLGKDTVPGLGYGGGYAVGVVV